MGTGTRCVPSGRTAESTVETSTMDLIQLSAFMQQPLLLPLVYLPEYPANSAGGGMKSPIWGKGSNCLSLNGFPAGGE